MLGALIGFTGLGIADGWLAGPVWRDIGLPPESRRPGKRQRTGRGDGALSLPDAPSAYPADMRTEGGHAELR